MGWKMIMADLKGVCGVQLEGLRKASNENTDHILRDITAKLRTR
jgi:hypothetical protein